MPKTRLGIEYVVRESKKAKNIIIRVTPSGVEVVIPTRSRRSGLSALVDSESKWIYKQKKGFLGKELRHRPRTIDLKAIGHKWNIRYNKNTGGSLSLVEGPAGTLNVFGEIDSTNALDNLLNSWVREKAKKILSAGIRCLEAELGVKCNRVSIRRQKTKWGSCSGKRNINLNQNILFLEPDMARSVLIHELCHLKELNHSPAFWELVEQDVPNFQAIRLRFQKTAKMVPSWAGR